MLRNHPRLLCLLALASTSASFGADPKIDQALDELRALRAQVSVLETRIEALEAEQASPADAMESSSEDVQPRQSKTLFDRMRVELQKAEVRASGPWTTPSTWDAVETGLSVEEVVELLGEPTARKFSVRRDTDEILHYRGDLEGTGEPIEGEIRIYKGKVRRFTAPDFPAAD